MQSDATTPAAYIDGLEGDRREAIEALRQTILDALPDGFEETVRWGMLTYEVPLTTFSDTYNGQPYMLAALASQKRHMAIYLTGVYADEALKERFVSAWTARGTRLDMGKSCVRFKRLDQVERDLVAEAVSALPVDAFIDLMQRTTGKNRKKR